MRALGVVAVMAGLAAAGPAWAQTTGAEVGLARLALALEDGAAGAGRTVIGVLPFVGADGSCSVMGTYVVDELAHLVVNGSSGERLRLVEPTQLAALMAQMGVSAAGPLTPAATRNLGKLAGVKTLVLGTITVIDNQVRIDTRLIEADSGTMIAAASVDVPRTATVDGLLGQSVTGPLCGAPVATASASAPAVPGPLLPGPTLRQGDLEFRVASAVRTPDHGQVTLQLEVTNLSAAAQPVIWVRPAPTILDERGNAMTLYQVTGMASCGGVVADCATQSRDAYVTLYPQQPVLVSLRFRQHENGVGDPKIEGSTLSLAGAVQILAGRLPSNLSLAIAGIPVSD